MGLKPSHGRLRIGLGATALLLAGAGIASLAGIRDLTSPRAQATLLHRVSSQQQLLSESLRTVVHDAQTQALEIRKVLDQNPSAPDLSPLQTAISHWAELDAGGTIRREIQIRAEPSIPFEALPKEIRPGEVVAHTVASPMNPRDRHLQLAFREKEGSRVLTVRLDSARAFRALSTEKDLRAYVVDREGYVLSHTQSAYAGARFDQTPVFTDAVRYLFEGNRVKGSGIFKSIDQLPSATAYSRLPSLPIALVVEWPQNPDHLDPQAILWRKIPAYALIGLGLLSLLAAALVGRKRERASNLPDLFWPVPGAALPAGSPEFVIEGRLIQNGNPSQDQTSSNPAGAQRLPPRSPQQEAARQILERFEAEATTSTHLNHITQRLAETISKLSDSPVLYFSHRESIGSAFLLHDAGFMPGEAPTALTVPVPVDVQFRISQTAKEGKIINLTQYPPLAQLVLNHFEVAHFEAWAVTGYPMGGVSDSTPQPRLMGIAVIIHAGVQSRLNRDYIMRAIRTAGLTYENVFGTLRETALPPTLDPPVP